MGGENTSFNGMPSASLIGLDKACGTGTDDGIVTASFFKIDFGGRGGIGCPDSGCRPLPQPPLVRLDGEGGGETVDETSDIRQDIEVCLAGWGSCDAGGVGSVLLAPMPQVGVAVTYGDRCMGLIRVVLSETGGGGGTSRSRTEDTMLSTMGSLAVDVTPEVGLLEDSMLLTNSDVSAGRTPGEVVELTTTGEAGLTISLRGDIAVVSDCIVAVVLVVPFIPRIEGATESVDEDMGATTSLFRRIRNLL